MTSLKFHFEDDLDYQQEAIQATVGLFRGQEVMRSEFTVLANPQTALDLGDDAGLGIGNRIKLTSSELHKNLIEVQLSNGLAPDDQMASRDFTIEMETGTGKTYVYLRSIFELNREYGFTKFVIVVPSIAIKEGVYKSIDMLREHFARLYGNTPFDFFQYNSSRMGEVRNFAVSNQVQIMLMTVAAINKGTNKIWESSEALGGEKAIDLIRATSPVVVIDEPQSVYGDKGRSKGVSGKGREAIDALGSVATFRYSATHPKGDKANMIYKLDAIAAYEKKLVKQIEVASLHVDADHTLPYVKLLSVRSVGNDITARLEVDVDAAEEPKRSEITVRYRDDLEQSTKRTAYVGMHIQDIRVEPGNEYVEIARLDQRLYLGQENRPTLDEAAMAREKIRMTVKEHFEKELQFKRTGHAIKVLSLFFIEAVANYRKYDEETGEQLLGEYASMFEQEFAKLASQKAYAPLFDGTDIDEEARAAHAGYFSIDKKGRSIDTTESNDTGRVAAEEGYRLIMKDKERLTSFETKLRFIFSHSALREGWDNPNVFQICSMRSMAKDETRRQTLGRGLRLAVDQSGNRVKGFEVNRLTVIADEPYAQFAEGLQKELESDLGVKFGVLGKDAFAHLSYVGKGDEVKHLGAEPSGELWEFLRELEYLDANGRVQDELRFALKNETVVIDKRFEDVEPQVLAILRRAAGRINVVDKGDRVPIPVKRAVLDSPDFKELWDRIKHRTTYRVNFDVEVLKEACVERLKSDLTVGVRTATWQKYRVDEINEGGLVSTAASTGSAGSLDLSAPHLIPDILTELQNRTGLTRRSLADILIRSDRLDKFLGNPEIFIARAADVINKAKKHALIEGVAYRRLDESHAYSQELFESEELAGYLKRNILVDGEGQAVTLSKSVHEHLVADSKVERDFALELDKREEVKVFAKLPSWFTIPTPLGSYNPDWAVLVDENDKERLYFVVETKGSDQIGDLRSTEQDKIKAAKKHFEALNETGDSINFTQAKDMDRFVGSWNEVWAQ